MEHRRRGTIQRFTETSFAADKTIALQRTRVLCWQA
jgi:hypothetical protein